MAKTSIESILKNAQNTLRDINNDFKLTDAISKDVINAADFFAPSYIFDSKVMSSFYASDPNLKNIYSQYKDCINSILKIRASYFTCDTLSGSEEDGITIVDFEADQNNKKKNVKIRNFETESFENAFFRALGMPSITEDEMKRFASGNGIFYYDYTMVKKVGPLASNLDAKKKIENYDLLIKRLDLRKQESFKNYLTSIDFFNPEVSEMSFSETDVKLAILKYWHTEMENDYSVKQPELLEQNSVNSKSVKTTRSSEFIFDLIQKVGLGQGLADKSLQSVIKNHIVEAIRDNGLLYAKQQIDQIYFSNYFVAQNVYKQMSEGLKSVQKVNMFECFRDLMMAKSTLFPPIQDDRIYGRITEPEKLVTKPFQSGERRVVNGKRVKISLLETIISLRLDSAGGSEFKNVANKKKYTISKGYGILESLIIVRLEAAIRAMAKSVMDFFEEYKKVYSMIKSKPEVPEDKTPPDTSTTNEEDENEKKTKYNNAQALIYLKKMRVIEESMLSTLGSYKSLIDSNPSFASGRLSESDDSYKDATYRQGAPRSEMISPVISVISSPLKTINNNIKKISKNDSRLKSKKFDVERKIDVIYGIEQLIGAVDIAVFTLALFTLDEASLVTLLSKVGWQNLRKQKGEEYLNQVFRGGSSLYGVDRSMAIDALSSRLFDCYMIFAKEGINYYDKERDE